MRVKTPDPHALETLKTKVVDPIVAGDASIASGTSNTGITRNTVELKKFTIRIDPILLGRIRAAYLNEFARGGPHRSLSAWAAHQLEAVVTTAESDNGREFTPVESGEIPTGPRRLGPSPFNGKHRKLQRKMKIEKCCLPKKMDNYKVEPNQTKLLIEIEGGDHGKAAQ